MLVNKKEAMCGRSRMNGKVEPFSTKCTIDWQCPSFVVTGNLNRLIAYDKILVAHIRDLYFSDRINRDCPLMLS